MKKEVFIFNDNEAAYGAEGVLRAIKRCSGVPGYHVVVCHLEDKRYKAVPVYVHTHSDMQRTIHIKDNGKAAMRLRALFPVNASLGFGINWDTVDLITHLTPEMRRNYYG